ncbi:helix-turn-helix domain-containing protein [Humibacter soli]
MNAAESEAAAALESSPRKRVLDVLVGSRHPLDATRIAEALGVHVTTARFHLDQLEATGLVRRQATKEQRKGRPRMVYSPAPSLRAADAREQLIEVLVGAIGGERAGDAGAARASVAAGERWAETLRQEPEEARDPVDGLVGVLDSLGFQPERSGDDVLMHECPFREAARERPDVVCSVHRGMIERLLGGSVGGSRDVRLIPFVEPQLCVVALGGAGSVPAGGVEGSGAATR